MTLLLDIPILLGDDPKILLEDNFSGGNIDPRWAVTDTESKITVSAGQLSFSGGKASPAWADPALVSVRSWARTAGLAIEWQVTPGATNTELLAGWTDGSLAANAAEAHGIYPKSTGVLSVIVNAATGIVTPAAYTAASLWFRIVLLATGALYYVSTDNRATWKIIWANATITTTPLYAFIESYDAALTADRVRVLQGSVPTPLVNLAVPTLTPSAGADIVVNGSMEADSDWVTLGTPDQQVRSSEQAHGGTYSRKVAYDGATGSRGTGQAVIGTVGNWYRLSASTYHSSGAGVFLWWNNGALNPSLDTGVWVNTILTLRRSDASNSFWIYVNAGAASTFYGDDVSIQPLTLSSLHGDNQSACKEGLFDRTVYCASGYQAGFWLNWDGNDDGTEDYVEAIVDRVDGTARLSKCVAGTITNNLVSGAITYSAGAILRVVRVGTSYQLYYNGAAVGAAQTISDAGITNNTGFCPFGTDPTDANASDLLTCRDGIGVA